MANICSVFEGLGDVIVNIIGGLKLEHYTSLNQEQFVLIVAWILFCSCDPEEPLLNKPP